MQAKLCAHLCVLMIAHVIHRLCGLSIVFMQYYMSSRVCGGFLCVSNIRHASSPVLSALSYNFSGHLFHKAVRLQVADFMDDSVTVQRVASALGSMCLARDPSDSAAAAPEALVTAVLALPQHLLQAITASLLRAHALPQLLDELPAALHCALLATAVQTTLSNTAIDRKADAERRGAPVHCVAHGTLAGDDGADGGGATRAVTRCLQLRREPFSEVASAALFAQIPHLAPLDAVICRATLPVPALIHTLSAHTSITRLDLSGAAVACTLDSARALAEALPSWPHLRSLWLDHRTDERHVPSAAASDILAPALARASALTSLNLSLMHITAELALAVGALAQLAELRVHACTGLEHMVPYLAALSRLCTLAARGARHADDTGLEEGTRLRGQFVAAVSTCTSLVHLDLVATGYDGERIELAALTQLESLQLDRSVLRNDLLFEPFAANNPACRFGLRALPHLKLLADLSIKSALPNGDAHVLGDALPRLPRLARLELGSCESVAGERARAEGWCRAPALRALSCIVSHEVLLPRDTIASTERLRALTALRITVVGDEEDLSSLNGVHVGDMSWLGPQLAQLTALREVVIAAEYGDEGLYYAPMPTLSVLTELADLRRLELERADLTDVEWDAPLLQALTALFLRHCHTVDVMPGVAFLTGLRELGFSCSEEIYSDDVAAFLSEREELLAGAGEFGQRLTLDLAGERNAVTEESLTELLDAVEQAGVQTLHVHNVDWDRADDVIAAFNLKLAGKRSCTQWIVQSATGDVRETHHAPV